MQFKHPEILYALFLVIIPIIVHLFQLQRFVNVPFTNVKFLKNIEQQTRKSARLKKWLVLLTRILVFTCLIFAFAQPYFTKLNKLQNFETTIYLDNSYSMQAKGNNGELLKSFAQKIIENTKQSNNTISLITNNEDFKNIAAKNLKDVLISINYAPNKMDLNTILLKLNTPKNEQPHTLRKNILISDFQNINILERPNFSTLNSSTTLLKAIPNNNQNIFIDSVFIEKNTLTDFTLKAIIKSSEEITKKVSISLLNNLKLIGKTTAIFNKNKEQTVQFTIPNTENFFGKLTINDDALDFDNDFYFSISKPEKINVISIGENASFLQRIYTENEFNFTYSPIKNINYNNLQNQHLIVLNEVVAFPPELISSLLQFCKNGGNLVIIPSKNSDINSYNKLLKQLNVGSIDSKIDNKHQITSINYEHPLLADVFEKRVSNFQYPNALLHYKLNIPNSTSAVNFDSNNAFISSLKTEDSNVYLVSSPLNKEVSNFIQSPIVVPIFYNFAKKSIQLTNLYYTIANEIEIEIPTNIAKDQVLKVSNGNNQFIPLQNAYQNKVILNLQDQITQSGFYTILNNNKPIKTIAFNYNREESNLNYANLKTLVNNVSNIEIATSIDSLFENINSQQKINWLFKWFLALSVLFLLIEMLLLKYFNI